MIDSLYLILYNSLFDFSSSFFLSCKMISRCFFKRVAYICPECHTVFRPSYKEAFFARHTRTLRKVTCTHCGHKGFCVETYGEGAEQ
jgi:DNA-directed RNA polymerase subunit RPC12/RpoP